MAIGREAIVHVANLSRLRLSEEEIGKFAQQLSVIIEYFDGLRGAAQSDEAQQLVRSSYERDDVATLSTVINAVLDKAPDKLGTSFKVPGFVD